MRFPTTPRMTPNLGANKLYSDRRFTITTADIRTPTTYYPIDQTVGRIRRDILYASLGFSALIGAALYIYFDLWFDHERIMMGAAIAVSLLIGSQFSILQLDARGFPPRMFFARAKTVRAVFEAITDARARALQSGGGPELDDVDPTD